MSSMESNARPVGETGNGKDDEGHDLNALAAELADLRSKLADLNDLVEDYVVDTEQGLVQNARRIGERVWNAAEHDASAVIDEIESNPVRAISIAFVAGALVAIFLTARR